MWLKEKEFSVKLGGNRYINTPVLISFKGVPLFTVYRSEDGTLGIDFEVFNAKGEKIATVKKNNIYPAKDHKSSFEFVGTEDTLAFMDKETGKAVIGIRKGAAAEAELDVSLTTYLPNGDLLLLDPDKTNLKGILLKGNTFKNANAAISIT